MPDKGQMLDMLQGQTVESDSEVAGLPAGPNAGLGIPT